VFLLAIENIAVALHAIGERVAALQSLESDFIE
jgi:hypothetical protein